MDETRLVKVAKALADPTRLRIFETILHSREPCCGDIGRRLPVTPATVSHHLRVLAEAGLVESRRVGQHVQLRAVPGALSAYRAELQRLADGAPCPVPPTAGDPSVPRPGPRAARPRSRAGSGRRRPTTSRR